MNPTRLKLHWEERGKMTPTRLPRQPVATALQDRNTNATIPWIRRVGFA
jgi:hypothetical protein